MTTARMTRAEAGKIGGLAAGERERMRYAARNLRMCQMRAMGTSNVNIAEEAGLSPSRTSRIIAKGEDHWQKWLDRAIEEGIEQEDFLGAVPEPDGERVEMIDVTTIHDNPFQPRKTVMRGRHLQSSGGHSPKPAAPADHSTVQRLRLSS